MRLNLKVKLLSAFGLLTIVIVALSLFSVTRLSASNDHTRSLGDRVVPATSLVGQAVAMMNKFRKDELHYILSTPAERAGSQGVWGDLQGDLSGMAQILSSYRSEHLISDPQDARDMAAFQQDFARYVALTAPFEHLADQGRLAAAGQVVGAGAGDNEYNLLKLAATAWTEHETQIAASAAKASQSAYSTSVTLILILTALGVLLAIAVALLLARRIAGAASHVGRAARAIAEGDVDQRIEVTSSDEIGQMARDFSTMVAYLREVTAVAERIAEGDLTEEVAPRSERDALGRALARMVENLRELMARITTASANLTESSQQMATTSHETGRAIDEIAAAVGQVASGAERQVRSVEDARLMTERVVESAVASADGARASAEAARAARATAGRGDEAVAQATAAMHAVRESSSAVTDAIRQLGAKSAEIGGIVATITTIAEQTNLLALNAAIEAARAGEQGRGFAVVAEEVRKLAEEAQQAAGSISGLIGEIQSETARTVEVVETGARRTVEGAETVERAREAFHELGASVEDMSGRVEEIASAIERIAGSARVVSENMGSVAAIAQESSAATQEVSASTEQTSASAQEIATSASHVASAAEDLRSLLKRFRLAG